ncbi:uncharacterized protein BDR25DRAFT_25697 [Lindgomyces ingoldianus]|uniref:Uncharacterized protein n=1 Tax=Lindgomyces ingoldianus TaxID=673940 RepID=A0ACB6QYF9_9PLEO|nr:uncharacterized protein BDR25DRAFT_25697 [Lindgomyces ingoldianus]KAF2471312.1 hypothetical protein BDR25DRAFT_25697 [Lindgomyces ingoldianus]
MANQTATEPRGSRFKEAAMNSTSSIHPPPSIYWQELAIDDLITKFNEEASAPPTQGKAGAAPATVPAGPPTAPKSAFGRFSHAVSSFWKESGLSVLGKRKAGGAEKEEGKEDERKRQAELAYAKAKAEGLLPAAKVFTRPIKPRKSSTAEKTGGDVLDPSLDLPAPSPALRKSPSKKDLHKQKVLVKRVSNLEIKLQEARKQLYDVLGDDIPPVPTLDVTTPNGRFTPSSQYRFGYSHSTTTLALENTNGERSSKRSRSILHQSLDDSSIITEPNTRHFWPQGELNPHALVETKLSPNTQNNPKRKITKKRKATAAGADDHDYKPVTTDSDLESYYESEAETKSKKAGFGMNISSKKHRGNGNDSANATSSNKKARRTVSAKSSGRKLNKKKSSVTKEEVVIIVPDGVTVPPLPSIPNGVEGHRAAVSADDGYGGLGHEMF